jgi:uncharacterized damage-inducible protein DinB
MQPYPVLETLFRHHLWANLQLLELCSTLRDEQLQASAVGGYGSIIDTLQHMVRAERSYLSRISTGEPYRRPEDAPPLDFAEMAKWLRHSGEGLIEWAPKVQAADSVEIQWDNRGIVGPIQMPKAVLLTQAINHATEHRAQIMAILTQLGVEPPELDSWSYFETQELKANDDEGRNVQTTQLSNPTSDFPKIGAPARRALNAAGYQHLEQLTQVSEKELLRLHGMGPKAIRILREALAAQGAAFADK